jgi:hypothetical protein
VKEIDKIVDWINLISQPRQDHGSPQEVDRRSREINNLI